MASLLLTGLSEPECTLADFALYSGVDLVAVLLALDEAHQSFVSM